MVSSCSATKSLSTGRLTAEESAAAALEYPKADRDLCGWSAKASDRCTQLARQRITAMQLAVAKTFADRVNLDNLAESETLESFGGFMFDVGGS